MKYAPLLVLLLLPVSAEAAVFRAADDLRLDGIMTDDVYAAGGTVTFETEVVGDVVSVGGELRFQGDIEEDLTAAAGTITVIGAVGDDVRLAGGEIRLEGPIGDDLFAAGGRIIMSDSSVVQGEARVVGGDLSLEGTYQTGAIISGGRVVLRGRFLGHVDVEAEEVVIDGTISGTSQIVADHIDIQSGAQFLGDVTYWQKEDEPNFGESLVGVTATRDESLAPPVYERPPRDTLDDIAASLLISTLFAAVVIVVFAFGAPKLWLEAGKEFEKSFGKSLLTGVLYVIGMPVLAIVLFITILGIPFSLLTGIIFVFTLYFARAITAMVLARWFDRRFDRPWGTWMFILASVVFYILLRLLGYIPIIGWLLCAVVVLAGLGAFITAKWKLLKVILKKL